MRLLIIILLTYLFSSCTKQKNSEDLITNGEYKYWLVEDSNSKRKSQRFYYFDKEGRWKVFYKYVTGEFAEYDGGDIVLMETWELISDSAVNIGGKIYNIKKLTNKEFIFADPKGDYTKKLVLPSDSLIPKEFLKLQKS